MGKRFQIQDPTNQGFPQVVDTCAWVFQWRFQFWPPRAFRQQSGPTYVVAMFSQHCPNATELAQELAKRLNQYTNIPPAWERQEAPYIAIEDRANPVAIEALRRYGMLGERSRFIRDAGHAIELPDDTPENMRGAGWMPRTKIETRKEAKPISIITISQQYCPGAATEAAILLESLNGDPRLVSSPARFAAITLEAE